MKRVNGVLVMLFWWLNKILFPANCALVLKFMITHKWTINCMLSQTFLTEKPIYKSTLETNANLPLCVCYFYYCCINRLLRYKLLRHWTDYLRNLSIKTIAQYTYVQYTNHEQWTISDLTRVYITFFDIFFEKIPTLSNWAK